MEIEGEERGKRVRMDVGERTQAKSTRGRQMLPTHTNWALPSTPPPPPPPPTLTHISCNHLSLLTSFITSPFASITATFDHFEPHPIFGPRPRPPHSPTSYPHT